MAEMQSHETRGRRGGHRGKKLSTRVDLTPMVDLGFLLITFFVFTTSLSEANAMRVIVPDDDPTSAPSLAPVSKTISLVLRPDGVYYYHGLDQAEAQKTSYSPAGIRSVLQQKIHVVDQLSGRRGQTVVLIKPTDEASYRNVVDILDEMLINGIQKYVLMDASREEAMLQHKE